MNKTKQAISEVLITMKNYHDLDDREIEAIATLISLLCDSPKRIRVVFYESFEYIHNKIKEEYAKIREEILNTIPEDKRGEIDREAKEQANEKLNKKNVVN